MKKIVLLSQKGGSGKTTLTVHLAVAAQSSGEDVVIVDIDPQASATAWSDLRGELSPEVTTVSPSSLTNVLKASQSVGKTLAIIDTAPHSAPGAVQAALVGDLILIPCRPTAFDLAAIGAAVNIVKASQKKAAFILNACHQRSPEVKEAREALLSYGFPVIPIEIGDRRAYARAVASGKAVTEFEKSGKAAQNINALWKWIKENLSW